MEKCPQGKGLVLEGSKTGSYSLKVLCLGITVKNLLLSFACDGSIIYLSLAVFCVVFVEFSGPSYKQTIQLKSGSSCFNQVIVRVRRNASDNVDMSTTPSTSRPILSSTVNMSLELTPDQSNYSSRHNASMQWSASQLPVNTTVHPANVTNNSNAILEVSSFYFKITS